MNNNEAIVIGWINKGKSADCGETMKKQLMIKKLEELGVKCHQIDFKNWRRHPRDRGQVGVPPLRLYF